MKNYQRLMMILSLLGMGLSGCATTLLTVAVHEQDHYSTKKSIGDARSVDCNWACESAYLRL